jgi:hypothetical protein
LSSSFPLFSSQTDFKHNDLWEFLTRSLSEDQLHKLRAKFKADCQQFLISQIHLDFEGLVWLKQVFKSKCLSEFTDAQPDSGSKTIYSDEQKIKHLMNIIESASKHSQKEGTQESSKVDVSQLQKSRID